MLFQGLTPGLVKKKKNMLKYFVLIIILLFLKKNISGIQRPLKVGVQKQNKNKLP